MEQTCSEDTRKQRDPHQEQRSRRVFARREAGPFPDREVEGFGAALPARSRSSKPTLQTHHLGQEEQLPTEGLIFNYSRSGFCN